MGPPLDITSVDAVADAWSPQAAAHHLRDPEAEATDTWNGSATKTTATKGRTANPTRRPSLGLVENDDAAFTGRSFALADLV